MLSFLYSQSSRSNQPKEEGTEVITFKAQAPNCSYTTHTLEELSATDKLIDKCEKTAVELESLYQVYMLTLQNTSNKAERQKCFSSMFEEYHDMVSKYITDVNEELKKIANDFNHDQDFKSLLKALESFSITNAAAIKFYNALGFSGEMKAIRFKGTAAEKWVNAHPLYLLITAANHNIEIRQRIAEEKQTQQQKSQGQSFVKNMDEDENKYHKIVDTLSLLLKFLSTENESSYPLMDFILGQNVIKYYCNVSIIALAIWSGVDYCTETCFLKQLKSGYENLNQNEFEAIITQVRSDVTKIWQLPNESKLLKVIDTIEAEYQQTFSSKKAIHLHN